MGRGKRFFQDTVQECISFSIDWLLVRAEIPKSSVARLLTKKAYLPYDPSLVSREGSLFLTHLALHNRR